MVTEAASGVIYIFLYWHKVLNFTEKLLSDHSRKLNTPETAAVPNNLSTDQGMLSTASSLV